MINLSDFESKSVLITDTNGKNWIGVIDSYNAEDDLDDYRGESIDVRINDTNELICFTPPEIQSIELI